jgi:hypothetical protein
MSHRTEIIRTKQLSDESLAVTIRCCGNPQTDCVLTLYNVGNTSEQKLEADIDRHHDRVAAKCAGMASGKHLLDTVVLKTKTHEAV